jgi:hypothetical protein
MSDSTLSNSVACSYLTSDAGLGKVMHKILTARAICTKISPAVTAWANHVEAVAEQEIKAIKIIQTNFEYQAANLDFGDGDSKKMEFAKQEQAKYTTKLSSIVQVPAIAKDLLVQNIILDENELTILLPFFISEEK